MECGQYNMQLPLGTFVKSITQTVPMVPFTIPSMRSMFVVIMTGIPKAIGNLFNLLDVQYIQNE